MITDGDRQALMIAKRRFRVWVEHMGTSIGRVSHPQHTGELMGNPQFFYFQQYINVRTLPEPQTESDLREQILALGDRGARAMDIYKDRHPDWARYTSGLAEHYFPTLWKSWAGLVGSYEESNLMNQVGRYTLVIARLATADMASWHMFHEWVSTFENEEINRRYTHLDDFDRAYGPHILDTLYCVHGGRDWVIFMRLLDDETIVIINYKPGPTGVAVIPVAEVAEMPIIRDFKWTGRILTPIRELRGVASPLPYSLIGLEDLAHGTIGLPVIRIPLQITLRRSLGLVCTRVLWATLVAYGRQAGQRV